MIKYEYIEHTIIIVLISHIYAIITSSVLFNMGFFHDTGVNNKNSFLKLIYVPFLEEFIFRFPLISNNIFYNIPSLLIILYIGYRANNMISFLIISPIITLFINNKLLSIILYCISFGLSHFNHFGTNIIHASIISLLIQGVIGMVVTYLALEYGIQYSILYHFIFNLLSFVVYFLLKNLNEKSLK